MEKEKLIKPIIIILIILLILIVIGAIYSFSSKPQNTVSKSNEELIHLKFDDIIKNNILFSNIKIYKQNNYFYLTATATNMTSNILKISPVTITLKNNNITLTSYIGDEISAEASKNIVIKTNEDLKNTDDIDINITVQVQS